jgi:hypothetical protein
LGKKWKLMDIGKGKSKVDAGKGNLMQGEKITMGNLGSLAVE